jgi:hypothetical protein
MMTDKIRRLTLAVAALAMLLVLLAPTPVAAATIDDPDDMQVLAAYVYEDCVEDGDVGALIYYLIDYTVLPDETATEAFMFIFIDSDGTTQLKAVAPYTFVDSGYGYGMVWIYFNAAEAATHSLDSADVDLYSIRLSGNPTVPAGWTEGDPPSTSSGLDYWQTTGTTSTLVALRVLYYADQLELLWTLDMIESTPEGNKLAAYGEEYFTNVIPGLRYIAPSAFAYSSYDPLYPDIDYETEFGGTVTSGTGTVTGSPVTLTEGENTITVSATGTFIVELSNGTYGTATDGTGTVTGSPVDLSPGTNTVTATATGTVIVDVALVNTQTAITDTITGTGWDLTDLAVLLGMSTMWLSSIVWSIVTLLVCAAVYKVTSTRQGAGASKVVFFVFNVMFFGGAILGFLPMVGAVLLFLGCDLFIGYIVFFKPANV